MALAAIAVCGQTARVRALLTQLQSTDPSAREAAFDALAAVPHVVTQAGVAPALISLLRTEENNYDAEAPYTQNEDWGSYYASVADEVFDYVIQTGDLSPLPLVINQPSNPGSLGEIEIAKLGAAAFPALSQVFLHGDTQGRETAIDIIGILLQRDRAGVQRLPPVAIPKLKGQLYEALSDKQTTVRMNAIAQFGHIGDPEDLPLLQRLKDDPTVGKIAARAIERFGQRSRDIVGPGRP